MFPLREKYAKYIFLIAFILMQIFICNSDAAISCIQCGATGTECSPKVDEKPTQCEDDIKNCYTKIDNNGRIERGCYNTTIVGDCKSENNCLLTGESKNNQMVCKKCDASDEKCSQTDMNLNDIKYNQICNADVKKCVVKVENKLVVRGCADDATKCTEEKTCNICDSVYCNSGIFPKDHLSCYQCRDNNCNVVAENISQLCVNYVENDECYTKGDSEATMVRGCKSDSNDNICSPNAEGCVFCADANCNKFPYKREQQLKCHQCVSTATNGDCFKEQTSETYTKCEKEILYNATEYCYTQFVGEKIQRGCLYDNAALTVDNCKDGDGDACNKCQTEGCNNKSVEFTCIVCRSDLDKNCLNNATALTGQKCRTEGSSPVDGCFHGIWHGVVIRGCLVDASIQNQAICKDLKNLQCSICHAKDCNNEKSSGTKTYLSHALMLLIVLITLWNFK